MVEDGVVWFFFLSLLLLSSLLTAFWQKLRGVSRTGKLLVDWHCCKLASFSLSLEDSLFLRYSQSLLLGITHLALLDLRCVSLIQLVMFSFCNFLECDRPFSLRGSCECPLTCGSWVVHRKNFWILFPNKHWESSSPWVSTVDFNSLPLVNPVYFSESSQTSAHLLQLLGTHIELHVHICGFLMSSVHIYSFTHQSLKHPRRAQGHITAFVGPTQFTFMVLSLQKHIKTFITVLA